MKTVGVIGAGVMGSGVAQCVAQAGYDVVLVDLSKGILEKAREQIRQNIRFQMFFNKSGGDPDSIISRIRFTLEWEELADADYVIENVTEKWEDKQDVYRRLEAICPPHCIYAANTSAISITRLASLTTRPAQVIGLHFMNPVPMKPVVETIRGYHTSEETIEQTTQFLQSIDKSSVLVNDSPGFVSNRVLMLTINEAVFLVADQVAAPEDVDQIFKSCFGHKMGPLETADLIGLDTILHSIEMLYESYNDSKYRPCPMLKKMVDAGLYGQKSGQGFFSYPAAQ